MGTRDVGFDLIVLILVRSVVQDLPEMPCQAFALGVGEATAGAYSDRQSQRQRSMMRKAPEVASKGVERGVLG